ncbi:GNAT family N-acetyltransferase [Roseateles saccharophilus]|uniref:Ribosomal-protein-alanine N-acetyltransferase n=1 Tax=Roseateles saccharophilus TaxID=304 RepID=A0A4R3UI31_ROSSA|nr:GNAT family protein [Roseateles saccharophilus]MDG0835893.1 N-acetyltransferase [Roseateles saccharophilus]TCU89671.1 ribosomal-protein-alanine N-acetyltransferase [Roseateles saccharophilus]
MPLLHLIPPRLDDADELLRFETDNRAFFEARVNARPAGYYSPEGVRAAIALAEREAAEDKGYQFLVRSGAGELVGRVNLVGLRRSHFHSADLGYRMAESACGKGYASEAVRLVLLKAFGELGLKRLEANARVGNEGSIRVLLRNGFEQFGHSRRSFELGGVWHDRLHFERHAD